MNHGNGAYRLLYDADRECPLAEGFILSREEVRCMLEMGSIAEGSIFEVGNKTATVRRREGCLVLETTDRRKQRDYPLPAVSG